MLQEISFFGKKKGSVHALKKKKLQSCEIQEHKGPGDDKIK